MKEQFKNIARLITEVKIGGIRLVEATVHTAIRSAEEVREPKVVLNTSTRVKEYNKTGVFFVLAVIKAQIVPRGSKEPVVSVKAGFELKYRLPEGFSASRSQLNTFARTNGTFNAWPYWREFIQNMFARMDLPPLTLPLFRMQRKPSKSMAKVSTR